MCVLIEWWSAFGRSVCRCVLLLLMLVFVPLWHTWGGGGGWWIGGIVTTIQAKPDPCINVTRAMRWVKVGESTRDPVTKLPTPALGQSAHECVPACGVGSACEVRSVSDLTGLIAVSHGTRFNVSASDTAPLCSSLFVRAYRRVQLARARSRPAWAPNDSWDRGTHARIDTPPTARRERDKPSDRGSLSDTCTLALSLAQPALQRRGLDTKGAPRKVWGCTTTSQHAQHGPHGRRTWRRGHPHFTHSTITTEHTASRVPPQTGPVRRWLSLCHVVVASLLLSAGPLERQRGVRARSRTDPKLHNVTVWRGDGQVYHPSVAEGVDWATTDVATTQSTPPPSPSHMRSRAHTLMHTHKCTHTWPPCCASVSPWSRSPRRSRTPPVWLSVHSWMSTEQ